MEALLTLTLFGSVIWFWISAIIFLFICFASDINENGFVAFAFLVVVAILYHFWGDIKSILTFLTFVNISIYLVIGLMFSAFRTFFAGRTLGKLIKDLPGNKDKPTSYYGSTKESEKAIFIDKLKGNIFRWWFMWPISLITWLVTDLFKDAWNFIYSKLKVFYNYILDLGIKSV